MCIRDSAYPVQLADLVEDMKKLDAASLEHIAAIVKEMVGNKYSHVRCKKTGTKRRAAVLRLVLYGHFEAVPEVA